MKRRSLMWAAAALLIAPLAGACASPPTEKISVAEAAVQRADTRQADGEAPLELRIAREKLEKAQVAMKEERYETARRMAEQAEVDAMLAEAKADTAAAQQSASQMRRSIETLRSEAERAARRPRIAPAPPTTDVIEEEL